MPAVTQQVTDNFITLLRNETTAQHAKLETSAISKALLSDHVSLNDYVRYLIKMRSVIAFCEQTIFPLLKHVIDDIESRRKLTSIEDDLKRLGVTSHIENDYHPIQHKISTCFALGYMYVIEGSTLGGRVILKHLQSKLGIDENKNGAFFAGYGLLTGRTWKRFLQILADYTYEMQCGDEVIEGAKHAFGSIHSYFEQ